MKSWKTISLFVCVFAFVREFRPIEPFYTNYMTSPAINVTLTQTSTEIYAVGAYSCFFLVIVVFLITDFVRYKPILVVDGICGMLTYCSIIGHPSIRRMQIGQMFYGFFFSSDVAYFGYLYAMTDDKRYYQKITGQARAACLSGKFFSSLFSQSISLVNGSVPYVELVYLSVFAMFFSAVWAFIMPTVTKSVYFNNDEASQPSSSAANHDTSATQGSKSLSAADANKKESEKTGKKSKNVFKIGLLRLWNDFKHSYSDPYVVKLSFWWAFAFGAYVQVYTYINVLYKYVLDLNEDYTFTSYNGAAESLNTLIGAIAAYSIGSLKLDWLRFGDLFLGVGSVLVALVLLGCWYTRVMWYIYAFYIIYGCLYQTMLTIAESEVAKRLSRDSYGLVFGFNSFVGLFSHTMITYGIVQGHFISVTVAQQFVMYSVYYMLIGVSFLIFWIGNYFSAENDGLMNCKQ